MKTKQLNQIASEDGLGFSLIRPSKHHPATPINDTDIGQASPRSTKDTIGVEVRGGTKPDVAMDDLVGRMEWSALGFLPRGVRKKRVAKGLVE